MIRNFAWELFEEEQMNFLTGATSADVILEKSANLDMQLTPANGVYMQLTPSMSRDMQLTPTGDVWE